MKFKKHHWLLPAYCILPAAFAALSMVEGFSQITFQKTYGGGSTDRGTITRQLPGGDFITGGYTKSFGVGDYDWYLLKTDPNGNIQWTKTYGSASGNMEDVMFGLEPLNTGGYLLCGHSDTAALGLIRLRIIKTDANGNVIWAKTHPVLSSNTYGFCARETSSGYIIAGAQGAPNAYLLKLDVNGNVLWSQGYGTPGIQATNEVSLTSDGGYIQCGYTDGALGNLDFYVVKNNSSGGLQWSKAIGGPAEDVAKSCQQTNDGGYIITGWTQSFGAGARDMYCVKLDSTGNLQWTKTYGGPGDEWGSGEVQQTADGGFIFSNNTNSFGLGLTDLLLVKTDFSGNLQWAKTYGTTGNEPFFSEVEQTSDLGYVMTGYAKNDVYLVKTDSSGNTGTCPSPNVSPIVGTGGTIMNFGTTIPGPVIVNWNPTVNSGGIVTDTLCSQCAVAATVCCPATVCANTNVTLSASGGSSYSWSTGATTSSITAATTATATYSVIVSDTACAGADTAFVTVTIVPSITASISPNTTICSGQTATLSASGGTPYSWSTGASTSSITVSPTATSNYSVIVGSGNCTDTATATITVNTLASSTSTTPDTCGSGNGSASITMTSGSSPYTYNWSPSGGTSSSATGLNAGNYSVTVIDANGCTVSQTVTVASTGNITVTISPNTTICTGQIITLTASGGNIYSWNNGNTTSVLTVSPSATTNYTVTVSNGACSGTAVVNITVSPPPVASVSGATICSGQTATLTAGGGGNYSWNTGQTTFSITSAATATTTYSVIVSIGSCSDTASATITVNPTPTVTVAGNTTLCIGDIATLTASGSNNYSWSSGSSATTINVSPSSSTTYTVTTTNGNCTSTTSITVVVSSPPTAAANNVTICDGQSAVLTASGGGTYSWSNGATTSSITIAATAAATYSVIVSIGSCSDTATATITVNPSPTASAFSNITITQGQTTTLSASGGGTYLWSNGSTANPITVAPLVTTIYCVTVTQNNCSDTACVTVTVEPIFCGYDDEQLFVPDAFSPNNDTKNDVLGVYYPNISCIKEFILIIYDRWGEKVFEADNVTALWDGTYKGKLMNTAVFVYYMKVTFITDNETIRKGNVSLI